MLTALDTETYLITDGILAPKLVCTSWADPHGGSGILRTPPPVDWFSDHTIFANAPFDLAVFCAADPKLVGPIFDALDAGLIHDVQTRQKLADLFDGKFRLGTYSLDALSRRLHGKKLDKDTWRLRYHDLDHLPTEDWPIDARRYAEDDSLATMDIFKTQVDRWPHGDVFADEAAQVRAHFALHLMACRGLKLDPTQVRWLKAELEREYEELRAELYSHGWMRCTSDKHGNLKYTLKAKELRGYVGQVLGSRAPLTPKGYQRVRDGEATREDEAKAGNVKIDEDTLRLAAAEARNPVLLLATKLKEKEKLLKTYLDSYAARLEGRGIVQPRFEILVETGRTSCRNPNVQNLPRDDRVRRCFTARDGYVLIACDFTAAELHTLAQVCIDTVGYSRLAEALNAGLDPHLDFAASEFMGIEYEEALRRKKAGDKAVKEARQIAKAANFGFPGMLGPQGFRGYAAGYGLDLGLVDAQNAKFRWERKWPEVVEYHAYLQREVPRHGRIWLRRSGRYRANPTMPQAANTGFQGLAADGAKAAAWALTRACFVESESPLFGVRPVNFVHDEVISECPEDRAHEAAMEMERLMAEVFTRTATPDVPCKAEATIMRSWTKADPVWRNGRLIPVEDAA